VIHQLIDARIEEAHELDLSDRPQSLRGHADAKAGNQSFRERSVENPIDAEALLQPYCRAEYTAIDADVFPENHHIGVIR
jgi:hypothetical protein